MTGASAVTRRMRLRPAAQAYLVIAGFTLLVNTINVFTALHDAGEHGMRLPGWEPVVWESTSGISTLLFCPIALAALGYAMPGGVRWPRLVGVHAAASIAYSALHVLTMNALRVGVYSAVGGHYPLAGSGFWYEYRKDLIAYVLFATIFWFFTRRSEAPAVGPSGRAMFDIRDGRRLLRVPIHEIAAVHAAGNYVEFLLTDGRRPLARQSLSRAQRELGDHFIRTHRSWAINATHVRELRGVGAGDYEIELAGGIKAPLSRRFPEALAWLRRPQPQP
jgi:hypothetical protein